MKKPKKEAYLDFINSLSKKEKPIDPPQNINNCKPMEGKELDALNKALKDSNNTP